MRFRGTLSPEDYGWAVVCRNGLFIAATLLFPYLLWFLDLLCRHRLCGLAFVVGFLGRPFIYVVFCVSFLGITARRLRDAGLPVWFAAAIFLLLFADLRFSVGIISPLRPFGIDSYALGPSYALAGLACIAALCLMERAGGAGIGQVELGVAKLGVALAGVLAVLAVASYPLGLRVGMTLLHQGLGPLFPYVKLSILSAAPLILSVIAVRSWLMDGAVGSRSVWIALAGVCCAVLAASVISVFVLQMHKFGPGQSSREVRALAKARLTSLGEFRLAAFTAVLILPAFLALMRRAGR